MTKVLVVATYTIKNAEHGGQRRVKAIVEAYRRVFKDVRFVSVFAPDYYAHKDRNDIAVKGQTRQKTLDSPYTGDIICGLSIYKDERVKEKFTKLLEAFQPDIIQVEQAFPYLGLKPLLKELGLKPKIVLSSHNIEYSHKIDILKSSGWAQEAEKAGRIIEECEQDMARNADLVVAVSHGDASELMRMGAKKVIVAPNGIAKNALTETGKKYWQDFKVQNKVSKIATFIGSAHPPNWVGFLDTVGDRVGFLPPDAKLVMAGSIADYFKNTFNDYKPEHAAFWKRVVPVGRISDELLSGLIQISDVILLPITEGGGSNLKTAEAILSGKKVVATEYAFRAFEQYISLPNIYIANKPEEFRQAILRAFEADLIPRTESENKLAEKVQWQYCLEPMVKEIEKL
jgi:hypothetical protein